MTAYRDQYASLFNNGQNVVLLGISVDSPEELSSWMKDMDFDYLFGSDPTSAAYQAFGGAPRDNGMPGARTVIVVDPEGRIAEVIPSFREVDPTAYEHLAEVIDRVTPVPEEGGQD